jgi:F420-dependent oxidoreductase-like protein
MQISILEYSGDPFTIDSYVAQLAQLRDEGFGRLWSTQLPYERDLLTALAVALREVDTIEVGSGVLPIHNQHPMQLAQRALTLNLIAGGRFTLGIGLTHAFITEGMWGVSWERPIRRLNEYLDGLLPLLAGRPADVSGELVTTRGALRMSDAPAPDVYVAALGPQMLRVAGRRTAGTVTWMTGIKTLQDHIGPVLRTAAEEAGREAGSVRVVAALPVSVTDDVAAARRLAAEEYAPYGRVPSYRAMLDREGFAGPEDAALIGDESVVSDRLDELRAAGVDEFVGAAFDRSAEGRARTRALLRRWAG